MARSTTPGHSWGQPDVAGWRCPRWCWKRFAIVEGAGQGGSSSQLLADLRPRSSATPLSLQGGARARPMAALQRWKEKQRWTRTDQAPRRFHEARQELPRTPRPKFPPCVVAVDCAGTAKAQFPRSRSCRRGAEMRIRRQFPSQLSQTSSKLSDAPDTSSLRRTGLSQTRRACSPLGSCPREQF